ncbi:aromatic acid exporter family protein [Pseudonocardia sp. KRD291]|uniref:FUSC family protein n=1 Tax=Pseudonocardia sp. KRD291 TaxID=2792007 RepID=UPI001C4A1E29|nr:FUSC family protein [Pseudonocardia sp. KRD291]MBW0106799.1 FUSC family protein [Pseudonocardia sp. KRD291]
MTGVVRRTSSRARRRAELGFRRLRASALPIVQCAFAAGLALYVAGDLVGHTRPFFAPIAAVISLGLTLNSRVRRAAELVVGVSLGVLVGDLLIAQIGSGVWQLVLVVALAMAIAVFTDGGTLIVAQAGASAVLVTTLLPPGETGGIDRCVDALIGGAAGILVAAVIPINPIRIVRREARRALDELVAVLHEVATALRDDDREAASKALDRARDTQPMIDELRAAVRSASEVASVSPLRRPRRRMLQRYRELAERTDYAMRNLRVLTRRALTALEDGEPVPSGLADTVGELGTAVGALIGELGVDGDRRRARGAILDVVRHAAVLAEDPGNRRGPSAAVLVAQVRSIAIDLLQATGLDRAEAQRALRDPP